MSIDTARTGTLCAILARRFPAARLNMLPLAVIKAQRAAHSAKAEEERECNIANMPVDRPRLARKAARIAAALADACTSADAPAPVECLRVTLGGDCRGPCGWLYVRGEDGEWMRGDDGWNPDAFTLY